MKYLIEWSERKNNDWIVATLKDLTGATFENVSINRKSKKGDEFINFDSITTGGDIEGNLWTSDKGTHYLFPPSLQKKGGTKPPIEKFMKDKQAGIEKSQDRKEEGIKHSSIMRMAHESALAQVGGLGFQDSEFEKSFDKWVKFYQGKWEQPF